MQPQCQLPRAHELLRLSGRLGQRLGRGEALLRGLGLREGPEHLPVGGAAPDGTGWREEWPSDLTPGTLVQRGGVYTHSGAVLLPDDEGRPRTAPTAEGGGRLADAAAPGDGGAARGRAGGRRPPRNATGRDFGLD